MPNESQFLTILVGPKWKRFCADCNMVLNVERVSLTEHCKKKHGGRCMGFLVIGTQAHKSMYKNFEEWVEDDSIKLEEKEDYQFCKNIKKRNAPDP